MKMRPEVTKAISKRDNASSRALVISNTSLGVSTDRGEVVDGDAMFASEVGMISDPRQTTAASISTARGNRMLFSK